MLRSSKARSDFSLDENVDGIVKKVEIYGVHFS